MIEMEKISSGFNTDKISFYHCTLKAGSSVQPELDPEKLIILLFDGNEGYINIASDLFTIKEPSVFAPDFDRSPYTIHAVADMKYLMCVFEMNEWDKEFYTGWHLTFPFFSGYSDGVRFRSGERSTEFSSWSLIQPFQIGHLSLNYMTGRGGKVSSNGNTIQNQWLYLVGESSFTLSSSDKTTEFNGNDYLYYLPIDKPYSLKVNDTSDFSCFWIEYFAEEDIQKNYLAQIFNGRMTETR